MITKFDNFLIESKKKYDWDEQTMGTKIQGKEIEAVVGKLVDWVKDNDYTIKEYDVEELYKLGSLHDLSNMYWTDNGKITKLKDFSKEEQKKKKDEIMNKIMDSNLKYPIIISVKKGKPTNILDGHHRIEKAHKLKKDKIKAYTVPEEDVLKEFEKKTLKNCIIGLRKIE